MPPRPRIRRGAPAARQLANPNPASGKPSNNGSVKQRAMAQAQTRMTPAPQQSAAGEVAMEPAPTPPGPPPSGIPTQVWIPAVSQRVRPAGMPATVSAPIPLANRVDAQNQEVLRRLSAMESMIAKQQSAIDHLTQLLHEAYGLTEPEVPSLDDALVANLSEVLQGDEFGGVAAGDVVEASAEQLGEEATSEDVVAETPSE